MSAYTVTLIIEQSDVIPVFGLRETSEHLIIMRYYPLGNILDAGIADEDSFITVFSQILDVLKHVHQKDVVHCDLKPQNLLVEKAPYFKVSISDFGKAKIVTNTTLLMTLCGSLKYTAPEVFPCLAGGDYGDSIDLWWHGVMVLYWIYGARDPPADPRAGLHGRSSSIPSLQNWISAWIQLFLRMLNVEENDTMIQLLSRMIKVVVSRRWSADSCLTHGMRNKLLLKRKDADGLIMCAASPDEPPQWLMTRTMDDW